MKRMKSWLMFVAALTVMSGFVFGDPDPVETPKKIGEGLAFYYAFGTGNQVDVISQSFDPVTSTFTNNAATYNMGYTKNNGTGIGTAGGYKKANFDDAMSGGGNGTRVYGKDANWLKPSATEGWTIATWALRGTSGSNKPSVIMVNGTVPSGALQANAVTDSTVFTTAPDPIANIGWGLYYYSTAATGTGTGTPVFRFTYTTNGSTFTFGTIVSSKTFVDGDSNASRWAHFAVTLTRGDTEDTLTLYVNGEVGGSTTIAKGSYFVTTNNGFYLNTANGGQGQQNANDDVAMWNRALTAKEIAYIAGEGSPTTAQPLSVTALHQDVPPYTATVSENTDWATISWTNAGVQTLGSALPEDAVCDLTITGNPTITFDASATKTIASLSITGEATFTVAASTIAQQTAVIFALPILTAKVIGTMPTATVTGSYNADYDVTASISATGLSISGKKAIDTININFHNGTAISGAAMSGFYPVARDNWSQIIGNNGRLTGFKWVKANGTVDTAALAGATAEISGTRGFWNLTANSNDPILTGYIDEVANSTPTVAISGIPFESYRVIVYMSTDTANAQFNYVTIGETNYSAQNGVTVSGSTAAWGNAGPSNDALPLAEGINFLISDDMSGSSVSIIGHRGTENTIRGCIAAIQIICTGDLPEVTGYTATVTTGDAQAWSGQSWLPGTFENGSFNTATLTFGGDTTFDFDESITAASVVATGTGAITLKNDNASDLSGVAAFDFSTFTGTTTVNFNTGASAVHAGADTVFTQTGAGALTIAEGMKATVPTTDWPTAKVSGAGTLVFNGDAISNFCYSVYAPMVEVAGRVLSVQAEATNDGILSVRNGKRLTIREGADITVATRFRSCDTGTVDDQIYQTGGTLTCSGAADANYKFGAFVLAHWTATSTYQLSGGVLNVPNSAAKFGADGTGHMIVQGTGVANFHSLSLNRGTLTVNAGGRVNIGATNVSATGAITKNQGSLILGGGTFSPWQTAVTVAFPVSLADDTVSMLDDNGFAFEFSNVLSGNGGINKVGEGTLTLSGANTYTGETIVSAGTLVMGASSPTSAITLNGGRFETGSNAQAPSTFTVNSNATLAVALADVASAVSCITADTGTIADDATLTIDVAFVEGTVAYAPRYSILCATNTWIGLTAETLAQKVVLSPITVTGISSARLALVDGSIDLVLEGSAVSAYKLPVTTTLVNGANYWTGGDLVWTDVTGTALTLDSEAWMNGAVARVQINANTEEVATLNVAEPVVVPGSIAVSGTGDVVFNGQGNVTTPRFDFSETTGRTLFEGALSGDSTLVAGANTVLTTAGDGVLAIGAGKKVVLDGDFVWDVGVITNEGTIVYAGTGTLATPVPNTGSVVIDKTASIPAFTWTGSLLTIGSNGVASVDGALTRNANNQNILIDAGKLSVREFITNTDSISPTTTVQNGGQLVCEGTFKAAHYTWDSAPTYNVIGKESLLKMGTLTSSSWGQCPNVVKFNLTDGGTLSLGNNVTLFNQGAPDGYALAVNNGILAAHGDWTIAGGAATRFEATIAQNATMTLNSGTNTITYNKAILGAGALIVDGDSEAGTIVLTAANTYAGGTIVSNGTLRVEGNGSLGAGSVTVAGGQLIFANAITNYTSQLLVEANGTAEILANTTYSVVTVRAGGTLVIHAGVTLTASTLSLLEPGANIQLNVDGDSIGSLYTGTAASALSIEGVRFNLVNEDGTRLPFSGEWGPVLTATQNGLLGTPSTEALPKGSWKFLIKGITPDPQTLYLRRMSGFSLRIR